MLGNARKGKEKLEKTKKVSGTENGDDWESILTAFEELFTSENPNQPKAIWFKTRKGRG